MGNKKKIAFITQNVAPFRIQWLSELKREYDITIFHLNDYSNTVNEKYLDFQTDGISVIDSCKVHFGKKFFDHKLIQSLNPDLYLLDGYGFIGQLEMICYLKRKRISFYMTIDGGIIPSHESVIKRTIKRFCLRAPKGIFSTSEYTDEFINRYTKGKVEIYRHYFSSVYSKDVMKNDQIDRNLVRNALGFEKQFIVLAVGRFIPIKGFDILLRSAALSSENIRYVFIGGTPPDEYSMLVKDQKNVEFLDFMPKDDLDKYYAASDVFVMPSRGDVWGLVIGEAMAYGLPIITSNKCIAGISMIKNGLNGYVIDNEDPMEYAHRIMELYNNPTTTSKMRMNNKACIIKYCVDVSAEKDLKTLDKLINQSGN